MWTHLKEYLIDFFELFYPNICLTCNRKLLKGEEVLCLYCDNELTLTGYWQDHNNPMAQRTWGRIELQGVAAFLRFRKGSKVQRLIHQLKYHGREDVGTYLGKKIAYHLAQPDSIIQNVELIVPVPLYWKKLKQRGYNQNTSFAKALSEYLKIPYSETALERVQENISQTQKKRYDRFGNVEGLFAVADAPQLTGKHILLVDDVFTTGATAEACLQEILKVPGTQVSFLSMAVSM